MTILSDDSKVIMALLAEKGGLYLKFVTCGAM